MAHYDKIDERSDLDLFLRVRELATGEVLAFEENSESPDFICKNPDGNIVGVEHTKIEYNPESMEIQKLMKSWTGEIDKDSVLWSAFLAIQKKEEKRKKKHWNLPEATILVLDLKLHDCYEDITIDDEMQDLCRQTGFAEIWISDHSSLEAFGEVTLIGLHPKSILGINGQEYLWGPPYK